MVKFKVNDVQPELNTVNSGEYDMQPYLNKVNSWMPTKPNGAEQAIALAGEKEVYGFSHVDASFIRGGAPGHQEPAAGGRVLGIQLPPATHPQPGRHMEHTHARSVNACGQGPGEAQARLSQPPGQENTVGT
jgi:hypothetical protein